MSEKIASITKIDLLTNDSTCRNTETSIATNWVTSIQLSHCLCIRIHYDNSVGVDSCWNYYMTVSHGEDRG